MPCCDDNAWAAGIFRTVSTLSLHVPLNQFICAVATALRPCKSLNDYE